MTSISFKKGDCLIRKGSAAKNIYIILKGAVTLKTEYSQITLKSGSIVGLIYGYMTEYICDCIAEEDGMAAAYPYVSSDDYKKIFREQPKYCYAFLHVALRQFRIIYGNYKQVKDIFQKFSDFAAKQYNEYEMLCSEYKIEKKESPITEFCEMDEPNPLKKWELSYFTDLSAVPENELRAFYENRENLVVGILVQAAEVTADLMLNMDALQENINGLKENLLNPKNDLLELWYDLSMKMAVKECDFTKIKENVQELETFLMSTGFYDEQKVKERMQEYYSIDFVNYVKEHASQVDDDANADGETAEIMSKEQVLKTDFPAYIMKYAGYEQDAIMECKKLLKEYDAIAEIQNYTPQMQKVRKDLTKLFYEIYEKAFLRAVHARSISVVMKLFFNFGILDLQMAGSENLEELMEFSNLLDSQWIEQKQMDKEGKLFSHVYTIYQWLCMVYRGSKEPSKNEFDLDYAADLLQQRKKQEITKEQENALKQDSLKKLQFEMHHMFQSNNRLTYGKITTFCPVLHRKDFVRSIEKMKVSFQKINMEIDEIRQKDYSCFFREVFFVAPQYGIERTEIMKEVLPDVILMPNIGSRAMMWQELAGVKKDTPARFTFSCLTTAELSDMMLELAGRYRWEICRKILGVRWNDIREKSLTSEFYDYVQFYRKNKELSKEAKEKVKAELVHAKNNYREVFVADYISWMKYEAKGNFRLNKVSRRIIAQYVPFHPDIRKKLEENPMYRELFIKCNNMENRKREKEKAMFDRYAAAGGVITPEIEMHLNYYGIH